MGGSLYKDGNIKTKKPVNVQSHAQHVEAIIKCGNKDTRLLVPTDLGYGTHTGQPQSSVFSFNSI